MKNLRGKTSAAGGTSCSRSDWQADIAPLVPLLPVRGREQNNQTGSENIQLKKKKGTADWVGAGLPVHVMRWRPPRYDIAAVPSPSPHTGDDGDFDLADALDPDPTQKPSGGLYPKLPEDPFGGGGGGGGGNIYPPPRPRPPQPRPPQHGGSSSYEDSHGGNRPADHSGGDHGSSGSGTVASIVSPIVSVLVLGLLGAGVSYFRSSGRGARCLRGRETSEPV